MVYIKINFFRYVIACLVVSCSCSVFAEGVSSGSVKSQKSERYSAETCPAESFEDFFIIFANNLEVQQTYTNRLVTRSDIDITAIPDIKYSVNTIEKKNLKFPLLPDADERKSRGYKFSFHGKHSDSVSMVGENNGVSVRFIFIRTACWQLIGVEDSST